MSNLLEQWNDHIIKGNQLSRELEDIESIIGAAQDAEVAFYKPGAGSTSFIRVLSPEKMQELKGSVVAAIIQTRDDKVKELEKLMGIRKPAIVNPEFEAAVQSMVDSVKKPDPIEKTLKEVLQEEAARIEKPKESDLPLFRDPGKDDKSLNKYPAKKGRQSTRPEGMTVAEVTRMYTVEGKEQKEIAQCFGVTESIVKNFLFRNQIKRKAKATLPTAETERP